MANIGSYNTLDFEDVDEIESEDPASVVVIKVLIYIDSTGGQRP